MKNVLLFDTTLRDGEQSPGVNLSINEKLLIAKQLEKLGIDIIEAGFPIASKGSSDAVKEIAKHVKKPIICALARSLKKDIDAAADALKDAARPRIHVFIATSNVHLDYKLKKSKEDVITMVADAVQYAKQFVDDIEFSPEDASRTDMDFMCKVIETAIVNGATTINVPDTVGYAQPEEFGERIKYIKENVPNIEGITISAHCHDDLGLSVANSLSAIKNGATQVEGTINGIGERAGNTALEEVIMALHTRKNYYKATTNIKTKELYATSRLIERLSGMSVQRNKAIIGKNAFSHEAGIHQHGVLANRKTYEIMAPEDVGWIGENISIGKLSGKHAVESVLKEANIVLKQEKLHKLLGKIKELADKKKQIEKADIVALAFDIHNTNQKDLIVLDELSVLTGNKITPSSTVGLYIKGEKRIASATGLGPVDAASNAIKKLLDESITLKEYSLKAITGGTDALANVAIKVEDSKHNAFVAEAVSEDVIMASVSALLKSVNKALIFEQTKGGNK